MEKREVLRPAIFLDRDGTINFEKEYLYRVEDWEWIPRAIEAIKLINKNNYLTVVVTNQAGIARGYYSELDVQELHRKVDEMLADAGAVINAYYYCPHHSLFGDKRDCSCRKPSPGMLLKAASDLNIDLAKSYMIGDKALDVEAGLAAGVTPILVKTGYGTVESKDISNDILHFPDIYSACKYIVKSSGIA